MVTQPKLGAYFVVETLEQGKWKTAGTAMVSIKMTPRLGGLVYMV